MQKKSFETRINIPLKPVLVVCISLLEREMFTPVYQRFSFQKLGNVSYGIAGRLAQLVEHRTTVREVVGSNPGRTNTQGL